MIGRKNNSTTCCLNTKKKIVEKKMQRVNFSFPNLQLQLSKRWTCCIRGPPGGLSPLPPPSLPAHRLIGSSQTVIDLLITPSGSSTAPLELRVCVLLSRAAPPLEDWRTGWLAGLSAVAPLAHFFRGFCAQLPTTAAAAK